MNICFTTPGHSSGLVAGTRLRLAVGQPAGPGLPALACRPVEGQGESGRLLHRSGAIPGGTALPAATPGGASSPITAEFGVYANRCWRIIALERRYSG